MSYLLSSTYACNVCLYTCKCEGAANFVQYHKITDDKYKECGMVQENVFLENDLLIFTYENFGFK